MKSLSGEERGGSGYSKQMEEPSWKESGECKQPGVVVERGREEMDMLRLDMLRCYIYI